MTAMSDETLDRLLEIRGAEHGPFETNAEISQAIKRTLRLNAHGWVGLPPRVQEALDCIAMKMSRIVSGEDTWSAIDNWRDIAGYARLGMACAMDEQVRRGDMIVAADASEPNVSKVGT